MGKVPRESSLIFFSRVPQRGSAPKKKVFVYVNVHAPASIFGQQVFR